MPLSKGDPCAYQLGRALSDTCWLANEQTGADFFLRQFDGHQIATLQTWLIQGGGGAFPAQSAAIVSRSLQHWQDWADINASKIRAKWATAHGPVVAALRTQAQTWFALLAGMPDTTSPPSLGALVHAGDSTLRATGRLRLAAARRSWLVTMILAAATGGLLYLAIANTSGSSRVWTSLAIAAAALGVTGANLRAAATTATRAINRDLGHASRLEAQVWNITWLPALRQGPIQRYRLAARGVAVPRARPGLPMPAPTEPPQHLQPAANPSPIG